MSARSMRVRELLDGVADAGAHGDVEIGGMTEDSRRVQPGDAFVALGGARVDGLRFAAAARARGATVVLADASARSANDAAIVGVPNLRAALGGLAARFFGDPSRALKVIGVTGTNGKTSTVQLLAQALEHAGLRAATIGTLGAGLVGAIDAGERTTPDVISVHGLLAAFRDGGASHVAMEVSSHALDQGRVDAVAFDLAVFTNLTRDHLDYHADMQAYGAAKQRLFAWPGLSAAIVNVDDAFGRALATTITQTIAPPVRVIRCAIDETDADVHAQDIVAEAVGQSFRLVTPWGEARVASALLGRFNVANVLAVVACLGELGVAFATIVAAVGALQPVAGRMSRHGGSAAAPLVVIDYAHTPDALEQALRSLRAHCRGELICVFGCGGERDAGKRPQMAAIAESMADRIIITDDNPRGEDGAAIVADIVRGLSRPAAAGIERDRARAIRAAVGAAQAGDVVLIAGKGHEPYQEIAGVRRPFDDAAVVRDALEPRA